MSLLEWKVREAICLYKYMRTVHLVIKYMRTVRLVIKYMRTSRLVVKQPNPYLCFNACASDH